jgi:hypothetical protein
MTVTVLFTYQERRFLGEIRIIYEPSLQAFSVNQTASIQALD